MISSVSNIDSCFHPLAASTKRWALSQKWSSFTGYIPPVDIELISFGIAFIGGRPPRFCRFIIFSYLSLLGGHSHSSSHVISRCLTPWVNVAFPCDRPQKRPRTNYSPLHSPLASSLIPTGKDLSGQKATGVDSDLDPEGITEMAYRVDSIVVAVQGTLHNENPGPSSSYKVFPNHSDFD